MKFYLVTYKVVYRRKEKTYSRTVQAETAWDARESVKKEGGIPLKVERLW